MSMLNRKKDHQQQQAEPIVPFQAPVRLSHRAASVAQEMERLEADLQAATLYGQEQANRAKVAEGMMQELKAENTHLLNERDDIQRQYIELDTRLRSAARVLVDVLKEPAKPLAEGVAAVEKALEVPTAPQE